MPKSRAQRAEASRLTSATATSRASGMRVARSSAWSRPIRTVHHRDTERDGENTERDDVDSLLILSVLSVKSLCLCGEPSQAGQHLLLDVDPAVRRGRRPRWRYAPRS